MVILSVALLSFLLGIWSFSSNEDAYFKNKLGHLGHYNLLVYFKDIDMVNF